MPLTWLPEWSVAAVRAVLRPVGLGDGQIVLNGRVDTGAALWATGSAVVDGRFVAKFALSAPTAERLWREPRVARTLRTHTELPVAEVIVAGGDPVFFVTRRVPGRPLSYDMVAGASAGEVDRIGAQLAGFLAGLHQPATLDLVAAAIGRPVRAPHPGPQATTDELRARLVPLVRPSLVEPVLRWCAWVDDVLAEPGPAVLVHGDFHGHNQVWDADRPLLRLVADLETCGAAEREYDLRYLPAFGPGVAALTATVEHYDRLTGVALRPDRILAWHVLSNLGEAVWRTEAGLPLLLPLPGGGSPSDYLDVLDNRAATLGSGPR